MAVEQREIVRRVRGLFALADQLELRLAKALGQVYRLTPSLPPSHGYGGTGLARAWTPSLPARSGCALSLREIRLALSQPARLSGRLVPQDPTDEPARKLLERIRKEGPRIARMTRINKEGEYP